MIESTDKVRRARARLDHAAANYLAALEQRQRLASNGDNPTNLEAASQKLNAAQLSVIAAMRQHGEAWRSQHNQAYQSLQRQLETGDAPMLAGFARSIGGSR